MDNNDILTQAQISFLKVVGGTPAIQTQFYLTGGTALAGFYIPYRYSEDLDFFSEVEIDNTAIQAFIKKISKELQIQKTEFQTSFNRNLFFLTLADKTVLKTEFTYFPFTPLDKQQLQYNTNIDSPLDIAVNKLFTVYQRSHARDYMDLFQLCQKYGYSVSDLTAKARLKFDSHIDLLKLGTQFYKAKDAIDLPRLIQPLSETAWRTFFLEEADKIRSQILE